MFWKQAACTIIIFKIKLPNLFKRKEYFFLIPVKNRSWLELYKIIIASIDREIQ